MRRPETLMLCGVADAATLLPEGSSLNCKRERRTWPRNGNGLASEQAFKLRVPRVEPDAEARSRVVVIVYEVSR